MQTIDSYVIHSTTSDPWRRRPRRTRRIAVFLSAAIAVGTGFAFFGRVSDPSITASRPKADARVVAESSASLSSSEEAKIAAFQEAAAISHLTLAASATGGDEAQAAAPVSRPTGQLSRKPAQKSALKSVVVAPSVPQARPFGPEVIMADLPPTPQVDPAPSVGKPPLLGMIAQDVESVPSEVQDFAHGMTDRLLGALANVRVRVGL